MKKLKLGIIGLSPGNGHPYSWSAIFNGYNEEAMRECPFPVIYNYLQQRKFPQDQIGSAEVTHIWTQDPETSKHVARASKIANVVRAMTDMIGNVDAVLLARDDADKHFEIAQPFIEAGLPVYIDKPLAYSVADAKKILALEKYPGQIFTCSGLRFSTELHLRREQRARLGNILHVVGYVPKDWKKYSIHIIDPVLHNLGEVGAMTRSSLWRVTAGGADQSSSTSAVSDQTTLNVEWESGVQATFFNFAHGAAPIQLQFIGDKGFETLVFTDSFGAFKASLEAFVSTVYAKKRLIPIEETLAAIAIVEKGIGESTGENRGVNR